MLLVPSSLTAPEALERCDRHLASRFRRWRMARATLPREARPDMIALLAWHSLARDVDRAHDEKSRAALLDDLVHTIDDVVLDRPRNALASALAPTVRRHALPALVFRGPLEERRRMEHVHTFETRAELLGHARRLVQPEGRLYLRVLGRTDQRDEVLADLLGQGLQLVHWLANLRDDVGRGRIHLAVEDLARHGVDFGALRADAPRPPGVDAMRRLVASQIAWARDLLARGWPLCRELGRWRGRQLAFVLRWHAATLSALEARRHDALAGPPPAGWLRLSACVSASLATPDAPRLA